MSTLTGRYRVDHRATDTSPTITEWYEHKAHADARETELKAMYAGRAVAWWWPSEYIETPSEEATRLVRDGLGLLLPWLKEAS